MHVNKCKLTSVHALQLANVYLLIRNKSILIKLEKQVISEVVPTFKGDEMIIRVGGAAGNEGLDLAGCIIWFNSIAEWLILDTNSYNPTCFLLYLLACLQCHY